MTKFLAIDYGLLRTGLSISDSDKIFAFPLDTMETNKLINYLSTLIEKENISRIIIGQPKRFSGQSSEIESYILKFIDSIFNNAKYLSPSFGDLISPSTVSPVLKPNFLT